MWMAIRTWPNRTSREEMSKDAFPLREQCLLAPLRIPSPPGTLMGIVSFS